MEVLDMVPVAGLEPARHRWRWILSPLRLPIPSHRRMELNHYTVYCSKMQVFFTRIFMYLFANPINHPNNRPAAHVSTAIQQYVAYARGTVTGELQQLITPRDDRAKCE